MMITYPDLPGSQIWLPEAREPNADAFGVWLPGAKLGPFGSREQHFAQNEKKHIFAGPTRSGQPVLARLKTFLLLFTSCSAHVANWSQNVGNQKSRCCV